MTNEELKALCEAAAGYEGIASVEAWQANARLLAAARSEVPRLLARVEELTGALRWLLRDTRALLCRNPVKDLDECLLSAGAALGEGER